MEILKQKRWSPQHNARGETSLPVLTSFRGSTVTRAGLEDAREENFNVILMWTLDSKLYSYAEARDSSWVSVR